MHEDLGQQIVRKSLSIVTAHKLKLYFRTVYGNRLPCMETISVSLNISVPKKHDRNHDEGKLCKVEKKQAMDGKARN
uniref:Uncharacterized protein n=1 Tax=Romanomermis culicivorax TaxID=13658 RepID=A0A915KPM2_ROMCU